MSKVLRFFQKDLVFTIAFALAVVSMFVVPPNPSYLGYIDFSVIGTLFCLMCVVAGLSLIHISVCHGLGARDGADWLQKEKACMGNH